MNWSSYAGPLEGERTPKKVFIVSCILFAGVAVVRRLFAMTVRFGR